MFLSVLAFTGFKQFVWTTVLVSLTEKQALLFGLRNNERYNTGKGF